MEQAKGVFSTLRRTISAVRVALVELTAKEFTSHKMLDMLPGQ